jgi:hypothetical protein
MPVGLGARKSSMDVKYFVEPGQAPDNYVSGGVASGQTLVKFPGFGGKGDAAGNWDSTCLLVWVITGAAIAIVLGVHASFGSHRLI